MNKIGIVIVLGAILILVGCNTNLYSIDKSNETVTKDNGEVLDKEDNTIVKNTVSKETEVKQSEGKEKTFTSVYSSVPSPKNPSIQKNANQKEGNNFDDKKIAWWIQLNKNHEPSVITNKTKDLIDKYGAIYLGDTSKKNIYLTFDEGYENGNTSTILDILKENKVKAIFFITGSYLKQNPELVKRMIDEGHQIGNHTVSHKSLPTLSDEKVKEEVLNLDRELQAKYNYKSKYIRPPMGEYNERILALCRDIGYKTSFWSFAYKDYDVNNQKGAENAYNTVIKYLHNGGVYLLHAVSKDNTEALDKIIKEIRAEGYTIKTYNL